MPICPGYQAVTALSTMTSKPLGAPSKNFRASSLLLHVKLPFIQMQVHRGLKWNLCEVSESTPYLHLHMLSYKERASLTCVSIYFSLGVLERNLTLNSWPKKKSLKNNLHFYPLIAFSSVSQGLKFQSWNGVRWGSWRSLAWGGELQGLPVFLWLPELCWILQNAFEEMSV